VIRRLLDWFSDVLWRHQVNTQYRKLQLLKEDKDV
jgi:hypothetical protein